MRVLVSPPSVSPSGSVTLVQNGHGSAGGASLSPESPEQAAAPRGIKVLLPRPRAKTPKTKTTSSKTSAAKPPKTEELDVSDLAKTRVYTKKMASTLDKAARVQVRDERARLPCGRACIRDYLRGRLKSSHAHCNVSAGWKYAWLSATPLAPLLL